MLSQQLFTHIWAILQGGKTPLMWAVEGGNSFCIEALLSHGVDINAADKVMSRKWQVFLWLIFCMCWLCSIVPLYIWITHHLTNHLQLHIGECSTAMQKSQTGIGDERYVLPKFLFHSTFDTAVRVLSVGPSGVIKDWQCDNWQISTWAMCFRTIWQHWCGQHNREEVTQLDNWYEEGQTSAKSTR